jgi:hypothetical protein
MSATSIVISGELAGVVACFKEWKIAGKRERAVEEFLFWVGFGSDSGYRTFEVCAPGILTDSVDDAKTVHSANALQLDTKTSARVYVNLADPSYGFHVFPPAE